MSVSISGAGSISGLDQGFNVTTGSVGVGTTNPGAKLEVHSDTIPRINTVFQGSKHFGMSVGGSGCGFVLTGGHFMTVNHQPYADRGTDNNLSERLRITSAGYVGINETSPDTYLHVKTGTDSALAKLEQTATNGRVQVQYLSPHGDWLQGIVGASNTGDYLIYTGQSKNLTFYTSGELRQKIQGDGKVIIGGSANQTANRDLSVVAAQGSSNEAQIGLQPTNSSGNYNPEVFISAIADGTYGAHVYFKTRDTSGNRLERLRITSDGKVGIGEGQPDRLLHLKAASSTAYSGGSDTADYNFLKIENTTNDKSAGIFFQIGGNGEAAITATEVADGNTDIAFQNRGGGVRSEKLRITSAGKLTVTPADTTSSYATTDGGIDMLRL